MSSEIFDIVDYLDSMERGNITDLAVLLTFEIPQVGYEELKGLGPDLLQRDELFRTREYKHVRFIIIQYMGPLWFEAIDSYKKVL